MHFEVAEGVATIRLPRPSLDAATKSALVEACVTAAGDDAVRCVVVTGTGRVFCAGQDLVEHRGTLADGAEAAFATIAEHYNPVVTMLATMPKPAIAAINGSCAGAALGIALACDLRVAATGARFTTAFTAIGLTPDSGLSASLARAIGTSRASELVLLAEPFDAEQALAWGLVNRVVADDDLVEQAQLLASRLAAGPTKAYAVAKRAMRDAWAAPWPEVLAAEQRDQTSLGATDDHRGATEAFLDKRKPSFTGR